MITARPQATPLLARLGIAAIPSNLLFRKFPVQRTAFQNVA
jgi:hypothetical protein